MREGVVGVVDHVRWEPRDGITYRVRVRVRARVRARVRVRVRVRVKPCDGVTVVDHARDEAVATLGSHLDTYGYSLGHIRLQWRPSDRTWWGVKGRG